MIREIKKEEITEAAKYAFRLNSIPKHNCKSFGTEYNDILKTFEEKHLKENDYLLGYFIEDKLEGFVLIGAEPDEEYVQTCGGFFSENHFELVAAEFYKWVKNKFKGYYFYMAYSQENKQAIEFCEKNGFNCNSRAYFMRILENEFRPHEVKSKIELLTEKHHESYIELHDVIGVTAYWNSKKILATDKFDIYVALENDVVIGEIAIRKTIPEGEVYFLGVREGISNEVTSDLAVFAMTDRISRGLQTMAYVECAEVAELNIYIRLGFHIGDTSIGHDVACL